MGSFRFYLGKGLRENCYLNRTVMVYGAPLNSVSIPDWNRCPAAIMEPAADFSLDGITEPCEVVVALAVVSNAVALPYEFTFRWFRGGQSTPLFTFRWTSPPPWAGWMYSYCYIGWVPWEIDGPGDYRVDIEVTGPERFSGSIPFTVRETAPPPPPVPVISGGLQAAIWALEAVSTWFWWVYLETFDWISPFKLVSGAFFELSALFADMAGGLAEFQGWVEQVTQALRAVISLDNLRSLILGWFPWLPEVLSWFGSWWNSVWSLVESWWLTAQPIVQGWISTATAGLGELLARWDYFWQVILPGLVSWDSISAWWSGVLLQVQGLINSGFAARESFWSGWQEMRENVVTFFQDPLGFLERKFTDWFLGGA